jgi:superfamily I DNA and/or RNA helicase
LQVVVATCNGAGEGRLEGRRFRIVVLDEASQATEAASLVALIKGAECVVMAGERAGWAGLGWLRLCPGWQFANIMS